MCEVGMIGKGRREGGMKGRKSPVRSGMFGKGKGGKVDGMMETIPPSL